MKFMRILSNVEYIADAHMQTMSAALLEENDLAQLAKKNGCKVVCITRYVNSRLAALSDVVIACGSNEGPLEGGASSTSMVQIYILDILYLQYFTRHYQQSKQNKSKTTEAIATRVL